MTDIYESIAVTWWLGTGRCACVLAYVYAFCMRACVYFVFECGVREYVLSIDLAVCVWLDVILRSYVLFHLS